MKLDTSSPAFFCSICEGVFMVVLLSATTPKSGKQSSGLEP